MFGMMIGILFGLYALAAVIGVAGAMIGAVFSGAGALIGSVFSGAFSGKGLVIGIALGLAWYYVRKKNAENAEM